MKKTKRLLSLALALLMVITLLPVAASAAPVSVSTEVGLITAIGGAATGDIIEIDTDIALAGTITIPAGTSVTIKGTTGSEKLTISGSRHFVVNGSLTLEDITLEGGGLGGDGGIYASGGTLVMNDGAVITKCSSTVSGSGVYLENGSTFTMNGGEITDNHQSTTYGASGGGVCLGSDSSYTNGSTFTMNGGKITNNSSVWGGGVEVGIECTFTMNGGEISGNSATVEDGGGVHVYVHGTFIMNDGIISNNKASSATGGGVFVGQGSHVVGEPTDWCKFIMNGGSIENNSAGIGGGVSAAWNGQIEMNGGSISNNTAAAGGGVYLTTSQHEDGGVSFTMRGGEISGNTATSNYGGGIWARGNMTSYTVKVVIGDGTGAATTTPLIYGNTASSQGGGIFLYGTYVDATIYDGKIYGNTAGNSGGGICIESGSKLDMYDGIIGGDTAADANWAKNLGGGVYVYSSTFTMYGGKIIGNEADTSNGNATGGGVALAGSNPVFTMNGGEISKNKAAQAGGVYVQGTSSLKGIFTMSAGKVSENVATTYYGGGIYATSTSDVTITGGEITGNKAVRAGGVYIGTGSTLTTISNAYITGNSGAYGGGIRVHTSGVLTIKDSYISDNSSTSGGGIYVVGSGKLNLEGTCYVTNNSATYEGGGIYTEKYTGYTGAVPGDYSGVQTGDYSNITTAVDTVFSGNTASAAYEPPVNADSIFSNIGYASSSIPDAASYINPINNYDINYAKNPIITFTVTYDANGGTGNYTDTGIASGSSYTVLANTDSNLGFTRSGYNFMGWNTSADGSGTDYAASSTFTITGNVTLYAQWKSSGGGGGGGTTTYTVTYDANGGKGSYKETGITSGSSHTVLDDSDTGISRSNYTFTGWNTRANGSGTSYDPDDTIKVTSNITLYAQWEEGTTPKPKDGTYTVTYDPNGGSGTVYSVTENVGDAHTVLPNSNGNLSFKHTGYTFRGWSLTSSASSASYFGTGSESVGANASDGDTITLYAVWSKLPGTGGENGGDPSTTIDDLGVPLGSLDLSNHFAYIIGYPDDTVKPEGNITRAEVSTVFFRLLTQDSRAELWSKENSFTDVGSASWHNNAVSTLNNANVLKGYSDGTFRPDSSITRAEFATIIVRFAGSEDIANATGMAAFSDISGHWAEGYIALAGALGYVQGYGDGTFRPDDTITRAEVATMLNNALNRHVESEDDLLSGMITWPDNQSGTWYYLDMQEATNSHFHERKDGSIYEYWTELRPAPDWAALEKPESQPGDVRY